MPQFRYAYNEKEELVDVLDLPSDRAELKGQFFCIGCGTPLTAKTKGEQREKHFAHRVNQNAGCAEETYLHKLAKATFVQVYSKCLADGEPFVIELTHPKVCSKYSGLLEHSCHLGTRTKKYDLTRYYNSVRLEPRDGVFIPDVIIQNTNDKTKKVYIEIAVTHFLSDEKRESGNLVIEIPIDAEGDVDTIRAKMLTESDASFVNFEKRPAIATDAECACAKGLFYCLMIYDSGKIFLQDGTLEEIGSKLRKHANVKYARIVPSKGHELDATEQGFLFVELVEEAYSRGLDVKNCFLCKYAGANYRPDGKGSVFCKLHREACRSNEAVQCSAFRVRPEVIDRVRSGQVYR